jgi:ubiquitin-protein ligase
LLLQGIYCHRLWHQILSSNYQEKNSIITMEGMAVKRLKEERKAWRKDHPVGFYARPVSKGDGSSDIMTWEAGIPGKEETDWAGGVYKVELAFSDEYPSKPPKCKLLKRRTSRPGKIHSGGPRRWTV